MKIRQKNVPWLGALVESFYTSLPVLSIVNFLSIITVLYATIQENLFSWAPWMTFWTFVSIMSSFVVVLIIFMYLVVVPSLWTFRNKQMNRFESDIIKEVRELRKELRKFKKEIK